MKNINKKTKGFTLVELLVVIAIIGLLAAIGIPAILNAQKASRNLTRNSQLLAVRNSMTDYFTRYNIDPVLKPGTGLAGDAWPNANLIVTDSVNTATRQIAVNSTDQHTYQLVTAVVACTNPSANKNIIFYTTATTINYCKEGGGEDSYTFKN
jgi:prepilin-type N-terminal cleavage/methylation domain-containing protein